MDHVRTFTVSVAPVEGGFRAVCLALPDCTANAPTAEEAVDIIESKIKAHLADAIARNQPVPVDRTSTKFLWIDLQEILV